MTASRITSLTAAFYSNARKNFLTSTEAKALVQEAKRDGHVSTAERNALKKAFTSAYWSRYGDSPARGVKFTERTMSSKAGELLYQSAYER